MVTSSSRSVFFIYTTCFLLVYSLFFSCVKTEVKNNLCQSWQYNLLATREELESRKASVKTQELMETWMLEKQFTELKFSKDGTFQMKWKDMLTTGTWKFKKRGKEIQIVIGEQKQLLSIDLITQDSLIITPITEEDEFTRVLLAKNS
jgi:cytochrome c oxidase assembly protein Cox11